jgi:hypothetical protein
MLTFFDADPHPDPVSGNLFDPGSGMEKIRIRDKRPVSATVELFLYYWTKYLSFGVSALSRRDAKFKLPVRTSIFN